MGKDEKTTEMNETSLKKMKRNESKNGLEKPGILMAICSQNGWTVTAIRDW